MARKMTATQVLMGEVISYGGLPVTRETAYRLAFEATEDRKAADMFAFAPFVRCLPEYVPLSYEEACEFVR